MKKMSWERYANMQTERLENLQSAMTELSVYLTSSKFAGDNDHVNVKDVLNRIAESSDRDVSIQVAHAALKTPASREQPVQVNFSTVLQYDHDFPFKVIVRNLSGKIELTPEADVKLWKDIAAEILYRFSLGTAARERIVSLDYHDDLGATGLGLTSCPGLCGRTNRDRVVWFHDQPHYQSHLLTERLDDKGCVEIYYNSHCETK